MLRGYVANLWWDALYGKIETQIPKINHLDSLLLHLDRHREKGILHAQHFWSPRDEERSKQEQAKYTDKATKGRIVRLCRLECEVDLLAEQVYSFKRVAADVVFRQPRLHL